MMQTSISADAGAVVLDLTAADGSHQVRWEGPSLDPVRAGDAAAVTALLPAMSRGEALAGPSLSPVLRRNLTEVQEVFLSWSRGKQLTHGGAPTYRPATLAMGVAAPPVRGDREVGLFFSGGVDSFHSVLRRRWPVSALVFVHGLDVRLDDPRREAVVDGVRSAAAELDLPLIEVATDVRRTTDRFVRWEDSHGAALAAVAHLLAARFETLVVPASQTYDQLYPLGSHPVLDPLWSSDAVRLVHDGATADRVAKVAAIARHPVARRWLRVCPRYGGEPYNCGACEKCLRTMAAARLGGVDGAFETLPPLRGPRQLARVAGVRIKGRGLTWQGYRLRTRRGAADPALRLAMDAAWIRYRFRPRG